MPSNILRLTLYLGAALLIMREAQADGGPGLISVLLSPCDVRKAVASYSPPFSYAALMREPLLPEDKLPQIKGNAFHGVIRLGTEENSIHVLLEERTIRGQKAYRVFFDCNANGSLADDGTPEPLAMQNGQPAKGEALIRIKDVALRLIYTLDIGSRVYLKYAVVTCRGGKVTAGGQEVRIALVDGNNDGCYDDLSQDRLVVDLNGDGILDGKQGSREILSRDQDFNFGGCQWTVVSLERDGRTITLAGEKLEAVSGQVGYNVGYLAPSFHARDIDGGYISLRNYRGKVVLLDFWATWCPPCLRELPNIIALYNRLKSRKDFAIIGISADDDASTLRNFIKRNKIGWPQIRDGRGGRLAGLYHVEYIPTAFLIDRRGKIIARGDELRGSGLAPTVEKALSAE